MSKIKSVSQFEDNIWGEATPIGADASNIDVEMSDSSTKDLQTVLGDIPSAAAPIQSQINAKVTASGGNIGNTTVSSGIQNFDSSSSETSTELLDTSVRVTNATEVTSNMWTKFNRFRKRVDNKFKDVFLSSVEDVASPSLTKTYSQSALNDYFANVVGYATAADLPDASKSIANQLSTLNSSISTVNSNISTVNSNISTINSNAIKNITRSGTTFTATKLNNTTFTFTQQDLHSTYTTFSLTAARTAVSISSQFCYYDSDTKLVHMAFSVYGNTSLGGNHILTVPSAYRPSAQKTGIGVGRSGETTLPSYCTVTTAGAISQPVSSSASHFMGIIEYIK